ncbi:pleckstrin homology domain-containing family G member 4B isoform X2 [Denticeps clupeoides]|uniref:pleckstrin homology domain-containing family G member 4B isoform X2 n=1 Tax=Denticeps clupeoides TaxID=299321 RepID=UPI0010A48B2B|nr:pleckstrin homology domain-containing family G member 4B isoform X2 [Denticeps clupeoides]
MQMLSLHKMHSRTKSRSCDNYLSIKDSESLDSCIQSTLSTLYPPFSATAATVLWQLFSVVERQYRGDGLRCFIDYLLPAKRILQTIQQETCLRFKGLLLYHEGWPLCIHEKVVLQLAPLHKVRLRQGDFYLQVVPLGHKSAKLVIKCLSGSGQAIAEIPIGESMYGSVFTPDFLQNVARDRNLHPLQNCLLTTGSVVYRTPWKNIVNPLFVTSTANSILQARCGARAFRGQLTTCSTSGSTGTLDSHRSSRDSLHSQGGDSTTSEPILSRARRDTRFNSTPTEASVSYTMERRTSTQTTCQKSSKEIDTALDGCGDGGVKERGIGTRTLSFNTDLSNPGPRRRHPRDSTAFETRRIFRKSYMEALQNPMNLGSSSESILEDVQEHSSESKDRNASPPTSGSNGNSRITQRDQPSRRRPWLGGDDSRLGSPLLHLPRGLKNTEPSRTDRQRSKSLERTNKASQGKGHRARSSSGGSVSGSPRKLINGYAFRFGKLELEAALPRLERRNSVKDDSGLHEGPFHTHTPQRNSHSGDDSHPARPHTPTAHSPLPTPTHSVCSLSLPKSLAEVNQQLLTSGAVTMPGNRDRCRRPVLQVCTRNQVWTEECTSSKELTCLLCYYYSTLSKDKRELGLTVLVDSRGQQASPALFSALSELQVLLPNALYSIVLLVDKEGSNKPERDLPVQCDILTALKALQKHVEPSQLTRDLEGHFFYDHSHFIQFRQKIEPFASSCSRAVSSLKSSISSVSNSSSNNLQTCKEVQEAVEQQRQLMKCVLEDAQLNRLRLEGGTFLARIRKEEACDNDNYRDAVDMVNALYNQVDEEVHKLVILSNKSLQELESLKERRKFEEESSQIKRWFNVEGEKYLAPLESYNFSLASVKEMKQNFVQFSEESIQHQKQGLMLIQECKTASCTALLDFKQYLISIMDCCERRKTELETVQNLHEFYDSANQWMDHCQDFFLQLRMDSSYSPTVVQILKDYHREATKFSLENFSSLSKMVATLNSSRESESWSVLWQKCQQTRDQLEEALAKDTSTETPSNHPVENHSLAKPVVDSLTEDQLPCGGDSRMGILPFRNEDEKPHSDGHVSNSQAVFLPQSSSSPSFDRQFPFPPESNRLSQSVSAFDDTDSDCTVDSAASCHSEPVYSPATHHRKHPLKKIMKKTLNYELATPRDNTGCHGYTGVYIKGLEVANNVSVEKKLQRPDIKSPVIGRSRSLSSPSRTHIHQTDGDTKRQSSKVKHIMDEMIATEREYVRSLSYIIENYFPEMERLDLPQDLRGKRSIIFGNMEKLWDFHSQYFLKELEHCAHSPLSISSCFLKHEDQFGMYALYSKNKPRSDALLTSHGNSFFKNKQVELGDKMDLASYLLKPIQRMSKYALLLKDLIKECSQSQEQELSDLRTAEEMVKFQLRHGNDLLAMDAIQGCDVNLKEQGQLRCQDEFIVWCGRRKYLRHVFLFEDLILFSKTKKIEGGYDIYIYKQSYKTAEIGMTENVGDSGLRFEIWFRRRKSQDTFILQASSAEVKSTWTAIIGKILWRQALRNRELRMQEMVSMGIGNKPFMDIKPSEAAISDRAVDYIMKGSESRTRASIAITSFDHSTPFKRPHSTISNSSTSSSSSQSSCSLLGSLNLHLYPSPGHPHPHTLPNGPPSAFGHWPYDCIEEDELEQDTGSQPSMITESSETSSDSTTGLSSITISAHSSIVMEAFPGESSSFLCSSSSPSPCPPPVPPSLFSKDQDLQPLASKFITAL